MTKAKNFFTIAIIITYNYGNDNKSGWNYLLTSYDENSDGIVDDNEKIPYDNIGNPLTYRGATIAWYGRQMRSFAKKRHHKF